MILIINNMLDKIAMVVHLKALDSTNAHLLYILVLKFSVTEIITMSIFVFNLIRWIKTTTTKKQY